MGKYLLLACHIFLIVGYSSGGVLRDDCLQVIEQYFGKRPMPERVSPQDFVPPFPIEQPVREYQQYQPAIEEVQAIEEKVPQAIQREFNCLTALQRPTIPNVAEMMRPGAEQETGAEELSKFPNWVDVVQPDHHHHGIQDFINAPNNAAQDHQPLVIPDWLNKPTNIVPDNQNRGIPDWMKNKPINVVPDYYHHAVPDWMTNKPINAVPDYYNHAVPDWMTNKPINAVPDYHHHPVPDWMTNKPNDVIPDYQDYQQHVVPDWMNNRPVKHVVPDWNKLFDPVPDYHHPRGTGGWTNTPFNPLADPHHQKVNLEVETPTGPKQVTIDVETPAEETGVPDYVGYPTESLLDAIEELNEAQAEKNMDQGPGVYPSMYPSSVGIPPIDGSMVCVFVPSNEHSNQGCIPANLLNQYVASQQMNQVLTANLPHLGNMTPYPVRQMLPPLSRVHSPSVY